MVCKAEIYRMGRSRPFKVGKICQGLSLRTALVILRRPQPTEPPASLVDTCPILAKIQTLLRRSKRMPAFASLKQKTVRLETKMKRLIRRQKFRHCFVVAKKKPRFCFIEAKKGSLRNKNKKKCWRQISPETSPEPW